MPRRRRLPLDLPALVSAFDVEQGATRTFLDRQSGAIEYVPAAEHLDDEAPFADVLGQPARWVLVPPLSAWQRHRLRVEFIERGITDPQARLVFAEALGEAGARPEPALAKFARLLRVHEAAAAAWPAFREAALLPAVLAWLDGLGLEPGVPGGGVVSA